MSKEIAKTSGKVRVGITVGDINGCGPELVIKSLSDLRITELFTPVIFCSSKVISFYKKGMEGHQEFNYTKTSVDKIIPGKINLVQVWEEEVKIEPGERTADGGKYALMGLEAATKALSDGQIDVLVTGPVDKALVEAAGLKFSGHTEYLGEKFSGEPMMILAGEKLRVALVTGHKALKEVSADLTVQGVAEKIRVLEKSMKKDFGIQRPKIAVLGLNPHAGDDGLFGSEEKEIILPAIKKANEFGILAYGPYAADGFFGAGTFAGFDAVLAMYHDQGLIPFKTLAGWEGVNFTANLSVVRTSPDHGPAFANAGKNASDETSFRNAMYMAADVYRRRMNLESYAQNPLPIMSAEELSDLK